MKFKRRQYTKSVKGLGPLRARFSRKGFGSGSLEINCLKALTKETLRRLGVRTTPSTVHPLFESSNQGQIGTQ